MEVSMTYSILSLIHRTSIQALVSSWTLWHASSKMNVKAVPISPRESISKPEMMEVQVTAVESWFKKDFNLQIYLHKTCFLATQFSDSVHKCFLNQTTQLCFLNQDLPVLPNSQTYLYEEHTFYSTSITYQEILP